MHQKTQSVEAAQTRNGPDANFESSSPFKDIYAIWKDLSSLPVGSLRELQTAVTKLATLSRNEYLASPAAFPTSIQNELKKRMSEDIKALSPDDLECRRKALRQMKYYLSNQAAHAETTNQEVALMWVDALTELKAGVAAHGTGKMFTTVFDDEETKSVIVAANAAARAYWKAQQLLQITKTRTPTIDSAFSARTEKLSTKHNWSAAHKAAYIACRNLDPITISDCAKKLGIKSCDQSKGLIVIKGQKTPIEIPPGAHLPWLVIRLLIEDKDCTATLYKRWDNASWNKKPGLKAFKAWIQPCGGSTRRGNKLRFHLKHPEKQ